MHRGAAIAQWMRLRLPFFSPGFETQTHAHYLGTLLSSHLVLFCYCFDKRAKKQKDDGFGSYFKNCVYTTTTVN